ncbi:MAG: hypothetical protein ACF8R7_13270 [Phycisphaerales bacterium JB039]
MKGRRRTPEGPTHFLRFEGVPQKDNPDYLEFGGAFINCWVRAPSLEAARTTARAEIADAGWTIIEDIEAYIIERTDYTDDQQTAIDRFDQAQIDGEVYEFNTYPPEDLDDDEDDESGG